MRWLPLLCFCVTACGATAVHPAPTGAPTSTAPLATIPLETYRGKLRAVHAQVNGHAGLYLFDSGAGITMITPDVARAVGFEPWGRLSGRNMFDTRIDVPQCTGLALRAAGFPLAPATVGVLDLAPLLPGGPTLDGIIALDGFAGHAITLDLAHDRLVVESPARLAARTAGLREGQARIGHEVEVRARLRQRRQGARRHARRRARRRRSRPARPGRAGRPPPRRRPRPHRRRRQGRRHDHRRQPRRRLPRDLDRDGRSRPRPRLVRPAAGRAVARAVEIARPLAAVRAALGEFALHSRMSRVLLAVLLLAACSKSAPAPAAPAPAARPSVDECKRALDNVIAVALAAFDDDPDFQAGIMAQVRGGPPGKMEARCHAEATPSQVACLAAIGDVDALRRCAAPVDRCAHSDPRDEVACRQSQEEWAWAADLIANVFDL
jgi:hypothetical protein